MTVEVHDRPMGYENVEGGSGKGGSGEDGGSEDGNSEGGSGEGDGGKGVGGGGGCEDTTSFPNTTLFRDRKSVV